MLNIILGLLFLIVPAIATAVSKNARPLGKSRGMAEAFPSEDDDRTPAVSMEAASEVLPAAHGRHEAKPYGAERLHAAEANVGKPRKMPEKKKIDPKMLVVYSEIMKPKYSE